MPFRRLFRPSSLRSQALLLWVAALVGSGSAPGCSRQPSPGSSEATRPPAAAPPRAVGAKVAPAEPLAEAKSAAAIPTGAADRVLETPIDPKADIVGGGPRAVRAEHGLVTSVDARATEVGVQILEAGGNAVDAAVAVAYALAVVHPSAGNLGGGGFMLVRPAGGSTLAIDFRETSPASLKQEAFDRMIADGGIGPVAVGVPGSVAGLSLAHRRFGRLPFRTLLAPAIALARSGTPLSYHQAEGLKRHWADLKENAAARREFGAGGGRRPLRSGERLRRPALADTIARIANLGDAGFYLGPVARHISAATEGRLTAADLSAYRAVEREPLEIGYRGLAVQIMPLPSSGGVAVAQTLRVLAALKAHEHPKDSAAALHLFIEALRRAQALRRFEATDPDALEPTELRARLARFTDPGTTLSGAPIDRESATPSERVHPLYPQALAESENTTHFSVIDGDGMVVSCTTTVSAAFGSRLVADGTGVVLNNAVASFGTAGDNLPVPGRRTVSSMAPTLVLSENQPLLVLGSPGGDTIPGAIVQVLRNVVDYRLTIDRAVDAPRVHHGFVPDELRFEAARPVPSGILEKLEAMGHQLSRSPRAIGDANAILIHDGVAYGYADPREGGAARAARAARASKPK